MANGLLRRIGTLFVAAALILGGALRVPSPDALAGLTAAADGHALAMAMGDHSAAMATHHHAMTAHGTAPADPARHAHSKAAIDCLAACAAGCTVLADPTIAPSGEPVLYAETVKHPVRDDFPRLGVIHKPPLFPPIAA
jgi:hypothetical protein